MPAVALAEVGWILDIQPPASSPLQSTDYYPEMTESFFGDTDFSDLSLCLGLDVRSSTLNALPAVALA